MWSAPKGDLGLQRTAGLCSTDQLVWFSVRRGKAQPDHPLANPVLPSPILLSPPFPPLSALPAPYLSRLCAPLSAINGEEVGDGDLNFGDEDLDLMLGDADRAL